MRIADIRKRAHKVLPRLGAYVADGDSDYYAHLELRFGARDRETASDIPYPFPLLYVRAQCNRRPTAHSDLDRLGCWYGYQLRCRGPYGDGANLDDVESALPMLRAAQRAVNRHRHAYGSESLDTMGKWIVVVLNALGFDAETLCEVRHDISPGNRQKTMLRLAAVAGWADRVGACMVPDAVRKTQRAARCTVPEASAERLDG